MHVEQTERVRLFFTDLMGSRESNVSSNPEAQQHPNSCAISCPDETAYPDLGGSVTCRSGWAPVCQCTEIEQKMAYCEVVAEGSRPGI